MKKVSSYFTVPFEFIVSDSEILYDIFVNSSTRESREHYVKIFPKGDFLKKSDLEQFKKKYHQVYIAEGERNSYLRSLVKSDVASDVQKTEVIKDSAIKYLGNLFDSEKKFSTEMLADSIKGCRDSVENMIHVIKDYDVSEIQGLIGDLSFHDFYTYDHSINVAMYSIALYKAYNPKASEEDIITAGLGGLLHDLGKIKIPTTIINNPDKLTDDEFSIIKRHPEYGKDLLGEKKCQCEGVDFALVSRVVYEHHENFNGSGYPSHKQGEDIHIMARITAIADFFDAITTKRSYHEVLSTEDALAVMSNSVGKKIDPMLFDLFTTKVKNLIFKGKNHFKVDDSFDPCQPHNVIPLEKIQPAKQEHNLFEKKDDFGKVKSKDPAITEIKKGKKSA